MGAFVVDASATLPRCFADEATDWTVNLLLRLKQGDRIVVPAHWPTEVLNALLTAVRRSRITLAIAKRFWDDLGALPVTLDPPLDPGQAQSILELSVQHNLTFYDAVYLELAQRLSLPLATLDDALIRTAPLVRVTLVP
jgi:predicted nucleic acid-binding protein